MTVRRSLAQIAVLFSLLLFLAACTGNDTDTTDDPATGTTIDSPATPPPPPDESQEGTSEPEETQAPSGDITLSEIAQHSTAADCWMAIESKVYDVTDYIRSHPGGQSIVEGCGTEATNLFNSRPMGSSTPHSSAARNLLGQYEIGNLQAE